MAGKVIMRKIEAALDAFEIPHVDRVSSYVELSDGRIVRVVMTVVDNKENDGE